jgi:hypothetical protein
VGDFFKKRTGRRAARYIKKKKNPNGELCTEKCELRMRITKDQREKDIIQAYAKLEKKKLNESGVGLTIDIWLASAIIQVEATPLILEMTCELLYSSWSKI